MDYIPAEKKQEVEGANAFFIIPALSGNTLMGSSPRTHRLRNVWLPLRNWLPERGETRGFLRARRITFCKIPLTHRLSMVRAVNVSEC